MKKSPESMSMAINPTRSRSQRPAPEAAATIKTVPLLTPIAFQNGEWPYPTTATTTTGKGDMGQQRPESYRDLLSRSSPSSLKRKNAEEESPRKRDSWTSPSSSLMTYVRPIIEARRDDAQGRYATATTEAGRRAEAVPESRSRHPEAQPQPSNTKPIRKAYAQYQKHWKEWCIRKEFSDGDWVTLEKIIPYLRELTALQSYTDSDVPRLNIKPLLVKSNHRRSTRRASVETLKYCMKAVRSLYREQCLVDGIIPDDSLGKNEVDMILSAYKSHNRRRALARIDEDSDDDEWEEDDDEGEEDDDEDSASEDTMDEVDARGEGSPVQEGTSSKETEASSAAPSSQKSRQQGDNRKEAGKKEKPKKERWSKRSGRALSPGSQRQDPVYVFKGTTRPRHLPYQTQWKEWCTRKRYADGHRVTPEKYATYIRELTARDEYYDKENPHLCIKPFIAHIHRGANAHRASKGTVLEALKAIRALYLDQCIVENVEPNVHRDLAKTSIDVIMSNYEKLLKECPGLPRIITPDGQVLHRKKERPQNENQEAVQQKPEHLEAYSQENEHQGVLRYDTPQEDEQPEDVQQEDVRQGDVEVEDVQEGDVQEEDVQEEDLQEENVQEETIQKMNPQISGRNKEPSIIQLKMVMKSLWNPQTKLSSRRHSWMIAHRERLRLAFGYFETDSRNDFATLLPPQIHHLQIRPEDKDQIPTQGVAVTLHSRKRYGDPSRYSIFLREEDVQVFFLLGKWTEKKSFPDFGSDNWATEPIEFLKDAPKAENTSSEQDGGANSAALFAKIIEANTEERPYSSFFSLLNPSPIRYQNSTKAATPAILTTTLPQPSVFHLPRNRLLPPLDLQRQLFPFIEDFYDDSADWKMWVENIMMDRPDATDRLPNKDKDVKYVNLNFPKIRYLLFVAGLRKVVLQDFAAMMACEPEEDGERKTGFDHTFAVKHPVLSSPAFREFAAQLREAMVADAVVKARVPTEAQELAEDEEVQSFEVQETVQASTKTTTQTKTTTTNRPVTRKGKENQSRVSTLDLTASSTDVVQVPVATGSHNLHNGTDSLLEVIQELCARVASLEQMEKQESEFATPASATTLLADTLSRDKDTSMDMDSNMDVNMDEDAANVALRNNDTSNSKDNDVDRLRRENQSLRDKLAALERVNRELAEENQRQSSLSCTPEPHVLSIPPAASATPSRVVSRASYGLGRAPNGRLGRRKNDSNIVSATCSTSNTVIQDDHTTTTIAAASIAPINTHNNNHTDIRERHRSHSATSTSTCETSMLRQEVQDLRSQLASLEQEEQGALNYAAVAIESVEFLDNKILQIEQSMHGLWTMISRNEAAKFASAGSGGPRSPAMGMAAAPPPPLSPLHQQHQQQEYQDPSGRASIGARLRVDTLPLRGRVVSSAVAASAAK